MMLDNKTKIADLEKELKNTLNFQAENIALGDYQIAQELEADIIYIRNELKQKNISEFSAII